MAKHKPHPLDIPDFLIAKGRAPRDEAEIQRICQRAEALRAPELDPEDHDPRLVDMARRGLISRSVLHDPMSIVVALNDISLKKAARELAGSSDGVHHSQLPINRAGVPTLVAELGCTPQVVRKILRNLMKKPAHGWAFAPADVPAIVKKIKAELKK
jgi:hypothetical protein